MIGRIAAYSAFKVLTDKGNSVSKVLELLIVYAVDSKHIAIFTSEQVLLLLKELFDFEVKEAVVKGVLRRSQYCTKESRTYCRTALSPDDLPAILDLEQSREMKIGKF